jgi:hypothetical protein
MATGHKKCEWNEDGKHCTTQPSFNMPGKVGGKFCAVSRVPVAYCIHAHVVACDQLFLQIHVLHSIPSFTTVAGAPPSWHGQCCEQNVRGTELLQEAVVELSWSSARREVW